MTAGGAKEEEGEGEGREGGEEGEVKMQEVLVLDGGFAGWQAKYVLSLLYTAMLCLRVCLWELGLMKLGIT